MKNGNIDLSKPGLGVGGHSHGGSMKDGKFVTPYPLDNSDYAGSGEHGKDMSVAASGGAGGYKGSTKGGNHT